MQSTLPPKTPTALTPKELVCTASESENLVKFRRWLAFPGFGTYRSKRPLGGLGRVSSPSRATANSSSPRHDALRTWRRIAWRRADGHGGGSASRIFLARRAERHLTATGLTRGRVRVRAGDRTGRAAGSSRRVPTGALEEFAAFGCPRPNDRSRSARTSRRRRPRRRQPPRHRPWRADAAASVFASLAVSPCSGSLSSRLASLPPSP